jgi:hypothetical protein
VILSQTEGIRRRELENRAFRDVMKGLLRLHHGGRKKTKADNTQTGPIELR